MEEALAYLQANPDSSKNGTGRRFNP